MISSVGGVGGGEDSGDTPKEALVQNRKRKEEMQKYVRIHTGRNTTSIDRKEEEGEAKDRDHRECRKEERG